MKMSYTLIFTNLLLVLPLLLVCSATLAFGVSQLPNDEVQALKDIAKTLGKTTWNFSADPCGQDYGWAKLNPNEGSEDAVTCNCTLVPNSTVCHVTSIVLKAQNLPGKLPPEFSRLPYLQEIDLTRNYLNGTIPPDWGVLPLVDISLLGNRLTGSIPVELANITTLKSLVLEINSLSGVLPVKLGNLPNIERMLLTSNNFTGELPETFAGLSTLQDFRISDNSFSGNIPNFIQNWTALNKLAIQASGLTGPIPSGISLLKKLTDMRVTDLNGPASSFPSLQNLVKLRTLMLRNCNITGQLPEYLGTIRTLKTLDLSFNKLAGEIPSSFSGLAKADYMFLTGNMLTGSVPDLQTVLTADQIDLSYNNFTTNSGAVDCEPRGGLNLFAGSSGGNTSSVSCLNITKCPKTWYSLHINCGGEEVKLSENFTRPTVATYEEDTDRSGPSSFYQSSTNWAISNTGYFPDDDSSTDTYFLTNSSRLSIKTNPQLYLNARLSPISLTYYGFCLGNGIYTVNLHFAEIKFTNDKTYSSLGRRIFDIYIQGSLVLKDFNIASDAGGFGIAVVKKFTANVTSNTLEIRLLWAGKGTTSIPQRGTYGPLISAISVDPNFEPPPEASTGGEGGISVGVVVGIVAGGVFIILLVLGILLWKGFIGPASTLEHNNHGVQQNLEDNRRFTYSELVKITKNFSSPIGAGGFGKVYHGILENDTQVAVKLLISASGSSEFQNEIKLLMRANHQHVVSFNGYCNDGKTMALVFEYVANGNLLQHLTVSDVATGSFLTWKERLQIAVDAAQGLDYLHNGCKPPIIHRDIKTSNILLTETMQAKICDFGISKLLSTETSTHTMTDHVKGTRGYFDPEYYNTGILNKKSDIYSFGIVLLELITGREAIIRDVEPEPIHICQWVRPMFKRTEIEKILDSRIQGGTYNISSILKAIGIAMKCVSSTAIERPDINVVYMKLNECLEIEVPLEIANVTEGNESDVCSTCSSVSIHMTPHIESERFLMGKFLLCYLMYDYLHNLVHDV
ncbi:probable leucine-rich repeat receptor-like serine/threonine-protein kinase At3g14840 [Argentina anserina]|uniref:probable leucine-rich repeat receptor-like serine/threonine-protein kinase At3g14840 n=1 Tax=Argentina anserina TaxID=57926 RepID=UPI0021762F88|nr:probable leucine-rich repeat receptor-like serine/threonine-protein kinase At3g14840 [Potentilla anserina]